MSFEERFNINVNLDEARKRFVNRIHNAIWDGFLPEVADPDRRFSYERAVISGLGRRYENKAVYAQIGYDFLENLRALEALYEAVADDGMVRMLVEKTIEDAFSHSELDLDVEWRDGEFYPKGAKLLDDVLVNDVLHWIRQPGYESVLKPYEKGMNHFVQAHIKHEILADVITDMYEALEALAKIVCERPGSDLSGNRELFLKKVKASDEYKVLLKDYIEYANRFRHAATSDKPKPSLSEREVESFVYMTGIFIRLTMPDAST